MMELLLACIVALRKELPSRSPTDFRRCEQGLDMSALGGHHCDQGLDMSALGGFNLGSKLPNPQATRHSFDYLPRVPQTGLQGFPDNLGLQRSPVPVDTLGFGRDPNANLNGASSIPSAEWDMFHNLASPVGPKERLPSMDYQSSGRCSVPVLFS
jgi:hypothetical protein